MFETLISAFADTWPVIRRKKIEFTGLVALLMFLMGIPCVMQGGMYVLQLMDWYSATFSLMFISMCECLLIYWVYGYRRFLVDISLMVRRRASRCWPIFWGFITPFVICALLIMSLVKHVPVSYNDYDYPPYAVALGWLLAACSLLPTPILAGYNLIKAKGTFTQRLVACLRPTPDWGPSRLGDRVSFRKSFSQAPSRQLYVLGVERQEEVVAILAMNRASFLDLGNYVRESRARGEFLEEIMEDDFGHKAEP